MMRNSSIFALGVTLLVGGCTTPRLAVPEPLERPQVTAPSLGAPVFANGQAERPTSLQRSATPTIPGTNATSLVAGMEGEPLPPLKGGMVNVNIEGMPVPAFINE